MAFVFDFKKPIRQSDTVFEWHRHKRFDLDGTKASKRGGRPHFVLLCTHVCVRLDNKKFCPSERRVAVVGRQYWL